MHVYRLCKEKYAHTLSGRGAALGNNRWNSKGVEIIYAAQSRSLAMAEVMVHISLALLPADYMMLEIDLPDDLTYGVVPLSLLKNDWDLWPPSFETQNIGNEFISQSNYDVLKVPSAVVKGDFNLLIHPFSKRFHEVKITEAVPFKFDTRLYRL